LVKVTIVPRGNSLGAAWYLPEERQLTTTEQILDEMCAALGGRAAELVTFGKISTGALSDLEKVTKQAYAMVSIYGLNDRIGNISFYDSQGRDAFTKPYSDVTARVIDEEVSKLVESQYQRAIKILTENKEKLTLLADKLLATEVIFKEDLIAIFGKREWDKEEEEEETIFETVVENEENSDEKSDENNTEASLEINDSEVNTDTTEELQPEAKASTEDLEKDEQAESEETKKD
jgi:cell division protease FtsH